ncbi:hypothetical protein RhiirA4_421057 [Rhizophagus irregularis]|uniref:Uncharacterized protein n=1 Tax=Rhizophagus irregularis TaxID=588596 RepID=A0A2I1GK56_9GLOM|nr:hypothetical protein RhiirA4_421057 [Rhizophagus irregularis]
MTGFFEIKGCRTISMTRLFEIEDCWMKKYDRTFVMKNFQKKNHDQNFIIEEQNACQVRIDALDTNIQKLTRKRPNENDYDEYSKTNTEQNENMNEKNRKDRHQPQDEKGTISSDSKNDFQKVKLMIGEDTNVNLVLEKSQAIKHQIHLSEYSENPSEKTIHDGYFTTPKQYEINIEDDDNVRNILKRKTNEDNNDEELFENAIFLFNRSNEEALIKKVDENSLLDETQLPLGKKMAQIA